MGFPILSRFERDAHVKTVEITPEMTMDEIAAACAYHSLNLHVKPRAGTLRVRPTRDDDGAPPWPRDVTAESAGVGHYDSLDIYYESAA